MTWWLLPWTLPTLRDVLPVFTGIDPRDRTIPDAVVGGYRRLHLACREALANAADSALRQFRVRQFGAARRHAPPTPVHVGYVLTRSADIQVIGVHTLANVAPVQHEKPIWHRTILQLPRNAMRRPTLAVAPNGPVSTSASCRRPKVAPGHGTRLPRGGEPLLERRKPQRPPVYLPTHDKGIP